MKMVKELLFTKIVGNYYIFSKRWAVIFYFCGGCMETYWKVNEVAAAIQVSEQTVYRYVANGEIPYHKLSRAVRFKPSEIESWMKSRKAGMTKEAKHGRQ
jgi:excisionase family DNA binding protein